MKKRISGLATLLTRMRLLINIDDGNTLAGSCSLPGWDEYKEPDTTFSETCSWSAHLLGSDDFKPEWTRKK